MKNSQTAGLDTSPRGGTGTVVTSSPGPAVAITGRRRTRGATGSVDWSVDRAKIARERIYGDNPLFAVVAAE